MGRYKSKAGIDWCEYCNVYPRNPCQSEEEAIDCPNCATDMRKLYIEGQPYYPRDAMKELAEYRRLYGPLKK